MNDFRPSFLSTIPPVVKNVIAINIILWLATLVAPGFFGRWGLSVELNDIFGMHYLLSDKFNFAQLITYMFMHAGFSHLFFNMFALYMFGSVLEQTWGSKRFLVYYIITGIGAGLIQQLFWVVEFRSVIDALNQAILSGSGKHLIEQQDVLGRFFNIPAVINLDAPSYIELKRVFLNLPVTVGASGSVFGLLLAFGWLFPDARMMLLFLPVPIKAKWFVMMYGVAELFLGVVNFSGDSVAHFAHLGGMLFGAIMLYTWTKRRN